MLYFHEAHIVLAGLFGCRYARIQLFGVPESAKFGIGGILK